MAEGHMTKAHLAGVRLNKKGEPSIIHWRGLLHGAGRRGRCMALAVIVVMIAALSFTQLGFIGVGAAGSYIGYGIMLLAPIAFGALALGVLPGTLLGLVSGALLFAHSQVQPLDYFEMNFITPASSIVLFTVAAFFLSLLLGTAVRKDPPLVRRVVYYALICAFVSVMFSLTFSLNVIAQIFLDLFQTAVQTGVVPDQASMQLYAVSMTAEFGSVGLQVALDAALMFVTCVVGDLVLRRFSATKESFTLAAKFRGWLLLVVTLAFVITAGLGFSVITEQSKESAQASMQGEISYLVNQLQASDARTEELSGFLARDAQSARALSAGEAAELEGILSVDSLLQGYTKEDDGTIVVFSKGEVLLSDDPKYVAGTPVDDYIGEPVIQSALSDVASLEGEMLQVSYDENMLTLEDAQELMDFDNDRDVAAQMAFVCFGQYDDYAIMMIMPATKVFAGRNATMAWVTIAAFVLLVVVFLLVSRLLGLIVVRRIDETNGVLGQITDGNLDARVDIRDSREFASLSAGINTTVDALKGWIAEAETRMDAELATAKAIQESALPRIFPPYPDIAKFDVYATMSAAREVGGDFYDFFLIGDDAGAEAGKLGFVIADVSGKGVPAALFMMKAKTQLRDYLMSGMEPGEAVENANRQLCDGNDEGMFVTAWVGVLDYAAGHVDYVNAGHNPPLLWQSPTSSLPEADAPHVILSGAPEGRGVEGSPPPPASPEASGWRWLTEKSGMPLGLFEGFPYEAFSVECGVGDQFLLYTDGVTEAMSAEGELYGEERLEALVNADFAYHPRALVEAVRRDVARHAAGAEQSDDITVLALEVGVPPEVTATIVVAADDAMLPTVNEFIHTELDRRLCPKRVQSQLDIAVEELFVNVCHYAYGGEWNESGGMVRVSYTYSAEPPSVVVAIADEGVPYNPLAKPDAVTPDDVMDVPIGGLGILMAKKSVDGMDYERVDGSNVVTIVKKW